MNYGLITHRNSDGRFFVDYFDKSFKKVLLPSIFFSIFPLEVSKNLGEKYVNSCASEYAMFI